MFLQRLTLVALTSLLLLNIPGTTPAINVGLQSPPSGPPSSAVLKADDAPESPAPGRMFVTGRVLDPNGKPVPGATVMVLAQSRAIQRVPRLSRLSPRPFSEARG